MASSSITGQVPVQKPSDRISAESLYEAAERFVPEIRRRALKTERARRLDDDLVDAMEAAGLFSVIVPKRWGGAGLGPHDVNRIAEILASADRSTTALSPVSKLPTCLPCHLPLPLHP